MHAPSWLSQALYRIHPHLRLGWAGRDRKHAGELNPGSFAIVQLYHIRDVGTDEEPIAYRSRWDVDFVDLGDNQPAKAKRVHRGPIFNAEGGCTRDWDPLFRKPIWVANLDDYGFSTEDIMSGKFLTTVKDWLVPIKRRIVESAREQGRQLRRDSEAVAGEMTDFLWREAQKSDATSTIQAYKHCKPEMEALERQKEQAEFLPNYYMPPGV